MTQNGQFCPICNFSNLFPPKWLRMTRNGQFCSICNFSNLFPPKWLRMTQNGQFCPICNFSNLFPPKWLRMTRNGQFCPIHNFSNLFPPKWLRMTQNGLFLPIHIFSNFFPPKWLRMTRNGQFCMAKIKYTLIQGNFYERLLFYMDSCALSPMASLLFSALSFILKGRCNVFLSTDTIVYVSVVIPLVNTGHVFIHKTCAAFTTRINGFLDTTDLPPIFLHKEDIKHIIYRLKSFYTLEHNKRYHVYVETFFC